MLERGIPRHDYQIMDKQNNIIGKVTSGTQSPSLNKAIGLGYVAKEHWALDNEIFISIRNNLVKAKIVKFPLHKYYFSFLNDSGITTHMAKARCTATGCNCQ